MEVKKALSFVSVKLKEFKKGLKTSIIEENSFSKKFDLNFKTIKLLAVFGIVIFVTVVFLLPTDVPIEFAEKIERPEEKKSESGNSQSAAQNQDSAQALWAAPRVTVPTGSGGSQINYNTSMIVGSKGGNAKIELRSGIRVALRLMDKGREFILS